MASEASAGSVVQPDRNPPVVEHPGYRFWDPNQPFLPKSYPADSAATQWLQASNEAFADMSGALVQSVQELLEVYEERKEADKPHPKSKAKAKTTPRKARRGAKAAAFQEEMPLPEMPEGTFLHHLDVQMGYLMKVDKNQASKFERFKLIAIFCAITDGADVEFSVRGVAKPCRGWLNLRQLMKAETYNAARLAPRPSDCDYEALHSAEGADPDVNAVPREMPPSLSFINDSMDELGRAAQELQAVCDKTGGFTNNMMANGCVANALNQTMLELLMRMNNGQLPNAESGPELFLAVAAEQVLNEIPDKFDPVAHFIEKVLLHGQGSHMNDDFNRVAKSCVTRRILGMARLQWLCHIAKSLGQNVFLVQEGPTAAKYPYLPPLIHTALSDLFDKSDLSNRKIFDDPRPELDFVTKLADAKGKLWIEAVADFGKVLVNLHSECVKNDGKGFARKREELCTALSQGNAEQNNKVLAEYDLVDHVQPFKHKADLFPAAKTKHVADVMAIFDQRHAKAKTAYQVLQKPLETAIQQFSAVATETKLVVLESPGVVSAVIPAEVAQHIKRMPVSSLPDWWASLSSQEEHTIGCTYHTKKLIIAELNLVFAKLSHTCYSGSFNCNLTIEEAEVQGKERLEKSIDKKVVLKRIDKGTCYLPFWGRVVDVAVAARLPRQQCLPLGPCEGDDDSAPALYLDGSQNMNAGKSECCVAWLLNKPLPQPECDEDGTPKKKRRKGADADAIATHRIVFENVDIHIDGKKFAYQRPVMVDTDASLGQAQLSTFYREPLPFDTAKLEKPERRSARASSKGFMRN